MIRLSKFFSPSFALTIATFLARGCEGFAPLGATTAYLASLSTKDQAQDAPYLESPGDHAFLSAYREDEAFYEQKVLDFHEENANPAQDAIDFYDDYYYDELQKQVENNEERVFAPPKLGGADAKEKVEDNTNEIDDYEGYSASDDDYLYWVSLYDKEEGEAYNDDLIEYENNNDEEEKETDDDIHHPTCLNVLGTMLRPCTSSDTPYFRDSSHTSDFCILAQEDDPVTVCCKLSEDFLESEHGEYMKEFGLQVDDVGCLCVDQWIDAYNDGVAPPVFLEATHSISLEDVDLDFLRAFAVDHDVALERLQELQYAKARLKKLMEGT